MKVLKTVGAGAGGRTAGVRGLKKLYMMKIRRERRMMFMGVAIV